MKVCEWKKVTGKYVTTCSHQPARIGKAWMYCPFCGNHLIIDNDRAEYQKQYYLKNREKHRQYYKKYYQQRKENGAANG